MYVFLAAASPVQYKALIDKHRTVARWQKSGVSMTLTRKSAVHQASRPQLIDPNLGTMADRLRIQEHLDRSDGALASGTYVQLVNALDHVGHKVQSASVMALTFR